MTIFELIGQEVTARQVAELYGLKIDRSGRGFCPWHDDGRHAALAFLPSGDCYCHACHNHGDATDLAAQMLGVSKKEAAEQIRKDFRLDQPVDRRPNPATKIKRKKLEAARGAFDGRWGYLCEVVREADEKLAKYTPETIDAYFDLLLGARCKANDELDLMWEEMKCERSGRVHSKRVRQRQA